MKRKYIIKVLNVTATLKADRNKKHIEKKRKIISFESNCGQASEPFWMNMQFAFVYQMTTAQIKEFDLEIYDAIF
jgi:hypothetical protein